MTQFLHKTDNKDDFHRGTDSLSAHSVCLYPREKAAAPQERELTPTIDTRELFTNLHF